MLRYITWHIPTPGAPLPQFYIDADSEPIALRIHADTCDKDFQVDILDDGVSIMRSNNSTKWTFNDTPGYIEFGTHTGTFTVNELITGGTSSATARVSKNQFGRVTLYDVSGIFTAGETITGGSSGATGTVDSYVRAIKNVASNIVAGRSQASLAKNATSDVIAGDFQTNVVIREGSWLSLSVLESGAANVSIQLELNALGASEDTRRAQ